MLCAHFSMCSVQFVARYSLRLSRALRARWARFAGPKGGPNCTMYNSGGGGPPGASFTGGLGVLALEDPGYPLAGPLRGGGPLLLFRLEAVAPSLGEEG